MGGAPYPELKLGHESLIFVIGMSGLTGLRMWWDWFTHRLQGTNYTATLLFTLA